MCGICGFTGDKNQAVLKRMTDVLYHRGPDEEGFFSDGFINLGVRRLSIIDLDRGHQPIYDENKNICVVCNGEIYNSQVLRKELEKKGHIFSTDHSDIETIVHLYQEHGLNFMHKMNGMFAIALWDMDKKSLFLIRDRIGVKPLFYTVINGILIFGSEIKAILANPLYSKEMNYEAVYHYFTLKNIPSPLTAFKDIYELKPGEMLKFSEKRVSKNRWWRLNFSENPDYEEGFIKENIIRLLEDATRLRMVSDVPIGAYLSGGVDSSSVVAFMSGFSAKPVKTFSLGYADELKNKEADLYYARKVSKIFKTEHYEYIMSSRELVDGAEGVIEAFDQPFSGTISTYFLTKLIKEHVKVALTGDASDELFASYLSHRLAQPMHDFAESRNKFETYYSLQSGKSSDIKLIKELFDKTKGSEPKWRYRLGLFLDDEKDSFLTEKFKAESSGVSTFKIFEKQFQDLTATDPLNRVLEMEWNSQLPDQVLAFADFLSMAHSVEIRSPFLDYRLAEFAATIPGRFKINNGSVKDILKKSVEHLLPNDIVYRPKEGFVLPVFAWIEDQLEPYCRDVLSKNRLERHNFFKTEKIASILNDYYAGNKNNAGKIWNLMMFQLWWEKYFN